MLKFSKKTLFAIEAVVDIAYHTATDPVRSSEISRRQGIPRRYLEQVLQHLVHHKILSGQRGPRGGYKLARERRRISIGDIVRVVRDLEGNDDTLSGETGSEIGIKVVRPLWRELQDEVMTRLDAVSVEDLCDRARGEQVESEAAQVADFSI